MVMGPKTVTKDTRILAGKLLLEYSVVSTGKVREVKIRHFLVSRYDPRWTDRQAGVGQLTGRSQNR